MIKLVDEEARSFMFAEAMAAAAAVDRQFREQEGAFQRLGARLKKLAPHLIITCARGSSDHAATYAKYLIESRARAVCASAAPSISSLYASPLSAPGAVCLAISQSGRSPDIVRSANNLKDAGALVIALVNEENSPLADVADEVVPLCAGPEKSVAATKSYIASLAAIAQLAAHWTEDNELLCALRGLSMSLEKAWALDWRRGADALRSTENLYVLGRGLGLGVAQEAALKLKETCRIHAEAHSSAEVLHGPAALVREGFAVLAFAQDDETQAGVRSVLARLAQSGARVIAAGVATPESLNLPALAAHPVLQPILLTQSFYRMANLLSLSRGIDPDRPANLTKITETL